MAIINKTTAGNIPTSGAGSTTASDDQILISSPANLLIGNAIDGQGGTDEIRFTSVTAGQTLTLGAGITNVELLNIATGAGTTPVFTGTTALNVDAGAVTTGMTITGNEGANTIKGTAGTDTIVANGGSDIINGTVGDDDVDAGAGNDIILVAAEADHLMGTIDGGAGTDELRFSSSVDGEVLSLNAGDDNIEAVTLGTGTAAVAVTTGTADLSVDASAFNSTSGAGLTITGNAGDNTITGSEANDIISGGAGLDTLSGAGGDDVITGGAGADQVDGGDGNDVFVVASTTDLAGDTYDGGAAWDEVRLDHATGTVFAVADAQYSNIEAVTLGTGTAAAAVTTGTLAHGLNAAGYTGNGLLLTGNAGANAITGTALEDVIVGGAGADNVNAGDGDDIVILKSASEFSSGEKVDGGDGADELRFAGTTSGDTLTLAAYSATAGISSMRNLESVVIGTGTDVLANTSGTTALNVNAAAYGAGLAITGNDGANTITGTNFTDSIFAGGGNDIIVNTKGDDDVDAGAGNDVINVLLETDHINGVLDGGDGVDEVRFSSTVTGDTLAFNASDVNLEKATITSTIAVNVDASAYGGVDSHGLTITGNAAANVVDGSEFDDIIDGLGGNDVMRGNGGNDTFVVRSQADLAAGKTYDGGDGFDVLQYASTTAGTLAVNNSGAVLIDLEGVTMTGSAALNVDASGYATGPLTITGNSGNNIITGTNEDDVLLGGDGNDTFIIKSSASHGFGETVDGGNGLDEIHFASSADGDTLDASVFTYVEKIVLGDASVAASLTAALNVNIAATALVGSTIVGNAGDNHITGSNLFDTTMLGGAGNDELVGGDGNDTLDGGAGADTMLGGAGNDTYLIANLSDLVAGDVIEDDGGFDTVSFTGAGTLNFTTANLALGTVIEQANLGATSSTVAGNINASTFSNGLTIGGNAAANALTGTAFNDIVIGGAGADTLNGGNGDDLFVTGAGSDGSGDVINGGSGFDRIAFANTTVAVAAQTLTLGAGVTNVEQVVIGTANLADASIDNTGTTANNVNASAVTVGMSIVGNWGNNIITGGAGADLIEGSFGKDILNGGGGDDIIVIGDASEYNTTGLLADDDVVDGGLGNDTLRFTGTGGPDVLKLNANMVNIEQVVLGDNSDTDPLAAGYQPDATMTADLEVDASALTGGIKIYGNDGNNVITGTMKADTLIGGGGDDVFIVQRGSAHGLAETIDGDGGPSSTNGDPDYLTGLNDEIRFTSTTRGDTLTLNARDKGVELVTIGDATGDTSGTATVKVNAASYKFDLQVVGNDGNNVITTGKGNDVIDGNAGNDQISAGAGDDEVYGGLGVDVLVGASGNDLLDGGEDNDIITGGLGNDEMVGGDGDDTFIITHSADHTATEVIDGGLDNGVSPGHGADTILFASRTNGDTLTLSGDVSGIETVVLGGVSPTGPVLTGTENIHLNASAVTDQGLVILANAGNNIIVGSNSTTGFDFIDAGAGNDTLTGGAGDDMFHFGAPLNATTNVDVITDFKAGGDSDMISLSLGVFTGLSGVAGDVLGAGDFAKGAGQTSGELITLNTTTGDLYYDADGAGAGAGVKFAHVDAAVAAGMSENDFILG